MIWSNIEYLALRLARKFLFTDTLLAGFGRILPYYLASLGESSPELVVDHYRQRCSRAGILTEGKTVLEVGIGATNGSGYEFAARGAGRFWGYEPFRPFDVRNDGIQLRRISSRTDRSEADLLRAVTRIHNLGVVAGGSVDLIVSYSVLEHVADPRALFAELKKVLSPGGAMIHCVDYRDHFFKYPFHFLQFSDTFWDRYLNPGDLQRFRLTDHLGMIAESGLTADVIHTTHEREKLDALQGRIDERFSHIDHDTLSVATADLCVRHE